MYPIIQIFLFHDYFSLEYFSFCDKINLDGFTSIKKEVLNLRVEYLPLVFLVSTAFENECFFDVSPSTPMALFYIITINNKANNKNMIIVNI